MDIKAFDAVSAYAKGGNLKSDGLGGAAGKLSDAAAGLGGEAGSFASMVEGSLQSSVNSTAQMERTVAQNLNGQADVLDVVTAVSSAEMAVETVVAVRDKVISAYNDIIKMPI